jgi:hypothetical protein
MLKRACRGNSFQAKAFMTGSKSALLRRNLFVFSFAAARSRFKGLEMISTWSEWKRYPRSHRGENLEAPISPGIYEVRFAATGALHSFGAVDNLAQALALLPVGTKSWFGRRDTSDVPELEYRTCATSTKADAKAAAERMIGRRETYLSGAA